MVFTANIEWMDISGASNETLCKVSSHHRKNMEDASVFYEPWYKLYMIYIYKRRAAKILMPVSGTVP